MGTVGPELGSLHIELISCDPDPSPSGANNLSQRRELRLNRPASLLSPER
jgi:hypothetical protein